VLLQSLLSSKGFAVFFLCPRGTVLCLQDELKVRAIIGTSDESSRRYNVRAQLQA